MSKSAGKGDKRRSIQKEGRWGTRGEGGVG